MSIHAPAKGATIVIINRLLTYDISIHAPAKGATEKMVGNAVAKKFQSTLP